MTENITRSSKELLKLRSVPETKSEHWSRYCTWGLVIRDRQHPAKGTDESKKLKFKEAQGSQ